MGNYQYSEKRRNTIIVITMIFIMVMSLFTLSLDVDAVEIVVGSTGEEIDVDDILTDEEIALMQSQEVYIVGYIDDFMPLSYVNADGEVCGAGMDVWNAVADVLDIEFQLVEATQSNISDGSVDVYLTRYAPDGIVMEQKSDAYYLLAYVYIHGTVYGGESDLPIGILSYFELTDEDIADWLGGSEVIVYESFTEMNKAFEDDEIQSMVLTSARFNNVKEMIDTEYTVEVLKGTYDCCLSFGDDFSEEKIEIINKVIAKLDDTTVNYSILEHSTYSDTTLMGIIQSNPEQFLQIILVIIIFLTLIGLLIFVVAEKKRKDILEDKLKIDRMTGLATGSFFEDQLRELLSKNPDEKYTIFSIDVDNFKYINEIYGHELGNQVLQSIGKYMNLKIPEIPLVARISGDQFVILVRTEYVTKGFLDYLEDEYIPGFSEIDHGLGKEFRFSFSAGYYHIVDPTMEVSHMINCARMGKELGKKTVGYTIFEFTPEMAYERANNNQIVATMNSAIEKKDFVVYYQPKVNLTNGKIVGAEALVRWVKDGKLIPPYKFIPIFEKNGFVQTLDSYVLNEVCRFIKDNESFQVPIISVNLSAVTVMAPDLVKRTVETAEKHGVKPQQLDLEVTESALVDKFESSIYKIKELRSLGFSVAMDDFGVGISSLSQLKKIPLDILKIDRGFVIDALTDEKGAAIVSHIVLMAQDLHLETVAEGIETRAQEEFFRNLGCSVGQGYYYSRPLPETEFLALLKKSKS